MSVLLFCTLHWFCPEYLNTPQGMFAFIRSNIWFHIHIPTKSIWWYFVSMLSWICLRMFQYACRHLVFIMQIKPISVKWKPCTYYIRNHRQTRHAYHREQRRVERVKRNKYAKQNKIKVPHDANPAFTIHFLSSHKLTREQNIWYSHFYAFSNILCRRFSTVRAFLQPFSLVHSL